MRGLAESLYRTWLLCAVQDAEARLASRRKRIEAARRILWRQGTMRRVGKAARALRTGDFHDRYMARDRAAANRLEDLAEIAVAVLLDMGTDLQDVQLVMWRSGDKTLTFRPRPSLEAAKRALARVDGYDGQSPDGPTIDEVLAGASGAVGSDSSPLGAQQLGQGSKPA